MDWSDLVPDLIKTPITVYKNRKHIQKYWKKILEFTDLGKTDIAILGRPAVGKSLLSSHLYGETTNLGYDLPSTSMGVETRAIQLGDWAKLFRVIPGQNIRERTVALVDLFNSNKTPEAIIYTVDWGYTDIRNQEAKEKLIKEENIDTLEKLRSYNLKNELKDLENVLLKLKECFVKNNKRFSLIIAVNKVDLFYSQINEAQKYYSLNYESDFTQKIKDFLLEVGNLNIKCVVVPISSYQSDLEWNGSKIKTNIGGLDNIKVLTLNFINEIASFSK